MLSSNFNQLPQNPPALLPEFEVPPEKRAYYAFLQSYPGYGDTEKLDILRKTEYGRLDRQQQIYFDYADGGLHADTQLEKHVALLNQHVFGSPHAANPTSQATTALVEETRKAVMRYFNASPREYTCIFTANATGALKLVGEFYPFSDDSRYLLTFDNQHPVNEIREFAHAAGAETSFVPLTMPDMRIDREILGHELDNVDKRRGHCHLFAFPAQSNFTGVKHPLTIIEEAQRKGWDVLLDATFYTPTNRLDLYMIKPNFVTVSFYKMFGYPTGVGALLVRNETLQKMKRPSFSAGTINFETVQGERDDLTSGKAGFEDGTLSYLSIPAVKIGLDHLKKVGVELIGERVRCLSGWLIDQLLAMRHTNNQPMVRIYGPASTVMRGGTITLNLYDPSGQLIDYHRVVELASEANISLRTGSFWNSNSDAEENREGGTAENLLTEINPQEEMNLMSLLQIIEHQDQKSAGAIRVSMGIVTNFNDVYQLVEFLKKLIDQTNETVGKASV